MSLGWRLAIRKQQLPFFCFIMLRIDLECPCCAPANFCLLLHVMGCASSKLRKVMCSMWVL